MVQQPEKQIHPHHQPLPAEQQPTSHGKAVADSYYNSPTMPTSPLTPTSTLPLPNSPIKIPRLGFGLYQSPPNVSKASCLAALKAGYRHIDSAQFYQNEAEMGEAARESGIPRSEIFLTTKILSSGGSPEATYKKCLESVQKIDGESGYVDLFLIHSPHSGPQGRKEMWQALERLENEGRAKAIGVSNFGISAIEELKSYARIWPPHVNQIELHPFSQQRAIVTYCTTHSITIEAYAPLVRNLRAHDTTLVSISNAHTKTTAQILIRYSLQKGWVTLPKSDTPSRIIANADVYGFELSEGEMQMLDGLDQGVEGAIVETVVN